MIERAETLRVMTQRASTPHASIRQMGSLPGTGGWNRMLRALLCNAPRHPVARLLAANPILGGIVRCRRASVAVEFAMIAPIFFLIVIATFELSLYLFLSGSVQSAVMMASRYGVTGQQAGLMDRQLQIADIVEERTWNLVTIQPEHIETLVYESFSDIGEPEPYTDTNGNGSFDAESEAFTDVNGNGLWDDDLGAAGLGGPGDIVLYKIEFTTDVLTNFVQPIFGEKFNYTASVAVRNEPF